MRITKTLSSFAVAHSDKYLLAVSHYSKQVFAAYVRSYIS
jgi:hypothetical protein